MATVTITITDTDDGITLRLENSHPVADDGPTDAQLLGAVAADVCVSCGDVTSMQAEPFNHDAPEPDPAATGEFVDGGVA